MNWFAEDLILDYRLPLRLLLRACIIKIKPEGPDAAQESPFVPAFSLTGKPR